MATEVHGATPQNSESPVGDSEPQESGLHPLVWIALGGVITVLAIAVTLTLGITGPVPKEEPPRVAVAAVVPAESIAKPAPSEVSEVSQTDVSEPKPALESTVKPVETTDKSASDDLSAEELFDRVAPSVVTIEVKDEGGKHIATGSGFFVDSGMLKGRTPSLNYVLTNYHVIRPAVYADIVLSTGEKGFADYIIAEDVEADLALLSVHLPANRSVAAMPLAIDDPRVGTTVYAIGSPEGLSSSLSQGIVSGFRELDKGSRWLQTTAPISHGSSGGPLVLTDGAIAGVTTLTRKDAQNLNFAIPVSKVRKFLSAEFRTRDIAEGASIDWHESNAFGPLITYGIHTDDTHAEPEAVETLVKARQEMKQWHHDQAISMAQQADKSLPEDFKYLAAYVIGKSSCRLAWKATIPTMQESETPEVWYARYRANDNAKVALRRLLQVTKSKPDFSPGWEALVEHYQHAGNWPDALLASATLIKLMPRSAEALRLRAECYHELHQPQSAKNDLLAALEHAPRTGELHALLARVLIDLGDFAAAIASCETALELNYYSPAELHDTMGNAYRKAGELEKAISEYEQAKAQPGSDAKFFDRKIAACKLAQR